jgi:hypothetical protein
MHAAWFTICSPFDQQTAATACISIQGGTLVCCLQPAKAPPRVFMLRFKEQSDRDKLFW